MALTDLQRLRSLVGEDIPPGGTGADTLFSDAELQEYIASTPNLDRAAYEAWRAKAARLANLVDTTEGNSQKKYSQLHDNAIEMIKLFSRSASGPTEGRTRVGKIHREALEW